MKAVLFICLFVFSAWAQDWPPKQIRCQAVEAQFGRGRFFMDVTKQTVEVVFAGVEKEILYDATHACGYAPPSGQLACDFRSQTGPANYVQALNCDLLEQGAPPFHLTHGGLQLSRTSGSGLLDCQSFNRPRFQLQLTQCQF